ncbi:hypothetical protein AXF42_Ash019413 [Apostasia shenzhenica]|uniref:Uncharacterized protein n=1 Tax=Apostasia shenzhenica TaxID=1088818 RepID=A0A2I0B4V8_9ASPA|nr:hypothetical protein AXF42_Ash019413 [Apostasia shenzhenica]
MKRLQGHEAETIEKVVSDSRSLLLFSQIFRKTYLSVLGAGGSFGSVGSSGAVGLSSAAGSVPARDLGNLRVDICRRGKRSADNPWTPLEAWRGWRRSSPSSVVAATDLGRRDSNFVDVLCQRLRRHWFAKRRPRRRSEIGGPPIFCGDRRRVVGVDLQHRHLRRL